MKVIDLLNKIANGEELPIHFICNGHSYTIVEYPVCGKEIINYEDEENDYLFGSEYELGLILNNKIELIEEDKEIEHYDMFDNFTGFGFGGTDKELLSDLQNNFEHINEELDYLIKAVNKLKKGK